MSTKAWLTWVIVIVILTSIIAFPGYDAMFLAAPLWLWIDIAAAIVLCFLNALKAKSWSEEEENLL